MGRRHRKTLTSRQNGKVIFIENDSWHCSHFRGLPNNASRSEVIQALKDDAKWQNNHNEEIQRRFDEIIQELENGEGDT